MSSQHLELQGSSMLLKIDVHETPGHGGFHAVGLGWGSRFHFSFFKKIYFKF